MTVEVGVRAGVGGRGGTEGVASETGAGVAAEDNEGELTAEVGKSEE